MPHPLHEFLRPLLASPILVVDDNEINRIFLEKTLRAHGFHNLLLATSAEEALNKIEQFRPEMVLLDILMPDGMDGFECCKAIRKNARYRDLPILIETSITEPALRVKAFEYGATDFVSKPIYPDELCARVTVHLERLHSMKTLQHYKSRIETELESARQLQQAILPEPEELERIGKRCGLAIAAHFEPSSEIGGDFWGVQELFPHQTSFWLVDFSGHGVAAAINVFRLHAYLKEYTSLTARPGEYLSYLNDKLLRLLQIGQFATMFYGIIDTRTGMLFYTCACLPHPFILRQETGKAEKIDGSGTPLGVGMHLYLTQTIAFQPGDLLFLYSDALTETPNAAGDYITEEQIAELLEENRDKSPSDLKQAVLTYFNRHCGDELRDDLTIVICSRAET